MDELARKQAVSSAIENLAKVAKARIAANKLALETRLGGRFADSAVEETDKVATLNAIDRINLKGMLGSYNGYIA
jgi:hypothetical protein